MVQTLAEMYFEQGKQRGELKCGQAVLLRQLRLHSRKCLARRQARINATTNLESLMTWLINLVDAQTLADVGIPFE